LTVLLSLTITGSSCAREAKSGTVPRVQVGLATYYGRAFHGQETASGETFDRREMVAAHRSLPFGTIVRVTNLENDRAVRLRIIDRGPYGRNFRTGTIIDVSSQAARRLGFVEDGKVPVRIEVLKLGDGERTTGDGPPEISR
jgi:rare lipoprotein A